MLRARLLFGIVALCVLAVGCIFSPHKGGKVPPSPPVYQQPTSPEAVLYNLRLAYTNKDSTEYKSLYHEQYQGSFVDQKDPLNPSGTYFKVDEAQHIAFLAKGAAIVDLLLSASLVRITNSGDPPGWITIQDPFQILHIQGTQGDGTPGDFAISPGAEDSIEMKFIPIPPSGSEPDTTWQIIRVVEIRR